MSSPLWDTFDRLVSGKRFRTVDHDRLRVASDCLNAFAILSQDRVIARAIAGTPVEEIAAKARELMDVRGVADAVVPVQHFASGFTIDERAVK